MEIACFATSESLKTTVTLEEIKRWMTDEEEVLARIAEANAVLIKEFPRGRSEKQDARLLAASKALQLTNRILDGDTLLHYANSLPDDLSSGDSEDEDFAYVFGLAFVSERCGNYRPPNFVSDGFAILGEILVLYGGISNDDAINRFDSKIWPLLKKNETSSQLFLSLFHYLPLSCEGYIATIYDSLCHEKLDGVFSIQVVDYPVGNYVANDIVYRLICKKTE